MKWLLDIDTLVFGGGGIRGLSFLGALEELETHWQKTVRKSLWDPGSIRCVCGASVGSLYALMMACRIPLARMKDVFLSPLWMSIYQQIDMGSISQSLGLIDPRKNLISSIEAFLATPHETFAELKARTGISLTVAVTCLDSGSIEYHNELLTPWLPICTSIMASCAIPFIFTPIRIYEKMYVDGALLVSVPLPKHVNWQKAFIFKCSYAMKSTAFSVPTSMTGVLQYFVNLVIFMLSYLEKVCLQAFPHRNRMLEFSPLKGIKSWDFHVSLEQRLEIYEYGKSVMFRYLNAPLLLVEELMVSIIRKNKPVVP